ncbi:MAG TPA: hypothetical protein VG013_30395 [Gemmataceae bacterium]|jgi:hypothetical protein|nr:hypothetical protein [Gemmataceae bacterium]
MSWRRVGLLTAFVALTIVSGCKKAAAPTAAADPVGQPRPGPLARPSPDGTTAPTSVGIRRTLPAIQTTSPVAELESKLERMIALLDELADGLEKVRDERSAEAAGAKFQTMMDEVDRLVEETAIGRSPLPRDQYQQIYERYRPRINKVGDPYMAHKNRIFNDVKLGNAFSRGAIMAPP